MGAFWWPRAPPGLPLDPFWYQDEKDMKSDMEDPRSGVQVGTQNLTFPEKAATNMKKWASRQGLEKGSCLEGVKTLKVITLTALWGVF